MSALGAYLSTVAWRHASSYQSVFGTSAATGLRLRVRGRPPTGEKGLTERTARVVVTMGMPAVIYRHLYRAHSIKSLERNVLGFVGFSPVRETLIGGVETMSEQKRNEWFRKLHKLGKEAK